MLSAINEVATTSINKYINIAGNCIFVLMVGEGGNGFGEYNSKSKSTVSGNSFSRGTIMEEILCLSADTMLNF